MVPLKKLSASVFNPNNDNHSYSDGNITTADNRKLFKIGVNFSAKTRNIEKWIVEF